ncbi:MAG TPA: hypothetical protein VM532_07985 [Burkholderiales bacterium]|nr:hypothetical protein [Burkholderiales bacterium]
MDKEKQRLHDLVLQHLHKVIEPEFRKIIEELNADGYKFQLYYPPKPGDIHYRELGSSASNYRALLAIDLVVSSDIKQEQE